MAFRSIQTCNFRSRIITARLRIFKPDSKDLAHVTRQKILHCTRAYIGDPVEYKKLMELRKPYQPPRIQSVQQPDGTMVNQPLVSTLGENEFAEISDAFETLVHQRSKSVS